MCQDKFCLCKCFVMARGAWKLLLLDSQRFRAEICWWLHRVDILDLFQSSSDPMTWIKSMSYGKLSFKSMMTTIVNNHVEKIGNVCLKFELYSIGKMSIMQILPPVNTDIEHPPFLDHFPNGNHTFCFCSLMVHLSLSLEGQVPGSSKAVGERPVGPVECGEFKTAICFEYGYGSKLGIPIIGWLILH